MRGKRRNNTHEGRDGSYREFRSCFDFINSWFGLNFQGIFVRLVGSIAGYVTKQTDEYDRKGIKNGWDKSNFD